MLNLMALSCNPGEVFGEQATIERAGRLFGDYFPSGRLAAFAASNSRDAVDFTQTIRHEILGRFGLDTFARLFWHALGLWITMISSPSLLRLPTD